MQRGSCVELPHERLSQRPQPPSADGTELTSTTRRHSTTKTAQQTCTRGRRDIAVLLESIVPNFAPECSPARDRTLVGRLERLKMLVLRVEARHHVRAGCVRSDCLLSMSRHASAFAPPSSDAPHLRCHVCVRAQQTIQALPHTAPLLGASVCIVLVLLPIQDLMQGPWIFQLSVVLTSFAAFGWLALALGHSAHNHMRKMLLGRKGYAIYKKRQHKSFFFPQRLWMALGLSLWIPMVKASHGTARGTGRETAGPGHGQQTFETLWPARFRRYALVACTVLKNEARWLPEWLEYHAMPQVGFQHFFLYDDASTDSLAPSVEPYVRRGLVTLLANFTGPRPTSATKPPFTRVPAPSASFCRRQAWSRTVYETPPVLPRGWPSSMLTNMPWLHQPHRGPTGPRMAPMLCSHCLQPSHSSRQTLASSGFRAPYRSRRARPLQADF